MTVRDWFPRYSKRDAWLFSLFGLVGLAISPQQGALVGGVATVVLAIYYVLGRFVVALIAAAEAVGRRTK